MSLVSQLVRELFPITVVMVGIGFGVNEHKPRTGAF